MDLDRFKEVNDEFGHATGDQLLTQVGQRLRDALRAADTVARLGGDEFAVLLDEVDASRELDTVAHRILDLFTAPFRLDPDVAVTASIVACTHRPEPADELLRRADTALYRVKQRGRNRYEIFDEPLRRRLHGRLRAEAELRTALTTDQIEVHYQPLLALQDGGRLDCVEALARWRHPHHGLLPAAEFIPLAEDADLITAVDTTVLAIAAHQQRAWAHELGHSPDVAVNLSASSLARDTLIDNATANGIDPHHLWVEITESAVLSDTAGTAARLDQLRGVGVRVATDDFGTGHASLAYLKHFPIDAVKIDKMFVDRLGSDPDDTAIVTAVISLGHALGVRVVAEGVETRQQHDLLTDLGCDYAQGHHIAPALPPADLTHLLQTANA